MKKSRLEQMQDQMVRHFDPDKGKRISDYMDKEFRELCASFTDRPESLESHTHKNIFPVVAAFRALLAEGMNRTDAAELAGESFLSLMSDSAEALRKILRFPGLYRLMPKVWKMVTPKLFSEDSGFCYKFYPTDKHRVKFDMLKCPYHQICIELDCAELAPVFCSSDDICYGHMHPRLIWNRTNTIARGGDFCDFDLYIEK